MPKLPPSSTSRLLKASTALIGIGFALLPQSAQAACTNYAPASGESVACIGTTTTPVSAPGSNDVILYFDNNATFTTPNTAIDLGNNALVALNPYATASSTSGPTIRVGTGTVVVSENATVSGGIAFNGFGNAQALIGGTVDSVVFSATNNANLILGGPSNVGTSTANSAYDLLFLGPGSGSFDTARIGTTLNGYDYFGKIDGSSTWTLTGTNVRDWYALEGTLVGTTANVGNIFSDAVTDGTFRFDQAANATYNGVIDGRVAIEVQGGGDITFANANTYFGGTTINGAGTTLVVDADNKLGSAGNVTLNNGGALQLGASFNTARDFAVGAGGGTVNTQGFNSVLFGSLSGTGTLTKSGSGTLTLSGASTKTGGFAVSAGTLVGTTGNLTGNIANSGTLRFDQASSGTYSDVISGTGAVQKTGIGSVTLAGANTYTGATTTSGGTLTVTADNNLGVGGALNLSSAATLILGASFDMSRNLNVGGGGGGTILTHSSNVMSGALSGTGTLTKSGTGTLELTGTSTKTGGFTVFGTLIGNTSNLTGNISNFGVTEFKQNANGTYSGVVSNTGSIRKTGTGTLILSGNNTYTGGTNVTGGVLQVSTNANLGGASGNIGLSSGGALQLGASFNTNRTLSVGAGGGTINTQGFDSTFSGTTIGTGLLTKAGTGTLTLTGTSSKLNGYSVAAGTLVGTTSNLQGGVANASVLRFDQGTNGTYNDVISGTGTLEKTGSGVLTLAGVNTYTGATTISGGTLQVSADNNLGSGGAVSLSGGSALQLGASFNTSRDFSFGAGGGIISTQGFDSTFSGNLSGSGTLAKTGSGTLTLTGASTKTGGFNVSAGTLVGTTGNLTGDIINSGILRFDQAGNGTYGSVISGTGAVQVQGGGIITFGGTNTYTGGTIIDGSTVIVSSDANLGGAGTLTLRNSGRLASSTTMSLARDIQLSSGAGGIVTSSSDITANGVISGTGSLYKDGTGSLILTGTNTYSGGTLIRGANSVVEVGADANLGNAAGGITLDTGGVLRLNNGFNSARTLNVSGGGTIDTQGFNSTMSGALSGTGVLTKAGSGNLTLTGTSTKTGGFAIAGGTLTGTTANLTGNIANSGSVVFDQAASGTYGGVVSGSGSAVIQGGGAVTFSGVNTYSGGTTVTGAGSRLIVAADSNLGNAAGAVTLSNGGALEMGLLGSTFRNIVLGGGDGIIDPSSNLSLNGVISGTGRLFASGGGMLSLNGANTYSGGTVIDGATIVRVLNDGNLGSAAGTITLQNGGTLWATASFNTARDLVLEAGAQNFIGQFTNNTLSGTISGTGRLAISGANSVLTLSGTNTYQGGTEIAGPNAVLLVGADANLGNLSADVTLSGGSILRLGASFDTARSLYIDTGGGTVDTQGFDSEMTGDLFGNALLTKSGSGTLSLTGTSYRSGNIAITAGTLAGDTDSLTGNIANAGNLRFDQGFDAIFSDVISGAGSFVKEGAGNLILSGTNTYTGTTTVNDGRLAVNGSIAGSAVTVSSGGDLGGSGTIGSLSLNGRLTPGNSIGTLNVAGSVNLNAGSTYEVEIDDALAADRLAATGSVTIDPAAAISILAAPGTYADGSLYTIITAGGGVSGAFGSLTHNLAFLTPSLVYNANDVQLRLSAAAAPGFDAVAKDDVQREVAQAIYALGAGNAMYDALLGLTVSDAQYALDTLSGEHIAALPASLTQSGTAIQSILSSRLQTLYHSQDTGHSAALAMNEGNIIHPDIAAHLEPESGGRLMNAGSRIWSQAFGSTGGSDRSGTAASQDRGSAGVLFGADYKTGEKSFFGLFGGYESSEANTYSERAVSESDTYHAGAYLTRPVKGGFSLSAALTGSYHDVTTKRYVVFPGFSEDPESDATGFSVGGFAELGYEFDVGGAALEPFAGVGMTYSYLDGYTETGGGAANLTVDSVSTVTPTTTLGLRGAKTLRNAEGLNVTLNGALAWQHSYGDLDDKASMRFSTGSPEFTTYGAGRASDAALVRFGADAEIQPGLNVYGGYSGTLASDTQDHALSAGFKLSF